jgi:hypothetical protein
VTARFRVFNGAGVGSWGFKRLGSRIYYFMGSIEVSKGKKI